MTWLDDINVLIRSLNPPDTPPVDPDDTGPGRSSLPDDPQWSDCEGYSGRVLVNYSGQTSSEFANLRVVTNDNTGMRWVDRCQDVVASLSTSDGPYPSNNQNVSYALKTNATIDTSRTNNDWIGYYIATGNAVLVNINRAIRVGRYQQLCYNSPRRSVFFLVTREPDVIYQNCGPGGQYAILGTYWPLYQAAQQRAGGLYGLGSFTIPQLPNVPAIPVSRLPSWLGNVPMPKFLQPWVAMVIPGYTKPTEQEVRLAKANITTGSAARDIGIGTVAIITLALGAIAYVVWTAKS